MAENAGQQQRLDEACDTERDHQGERSCGGLEGFAIAEPFDQHDQRNGQRRLECDGPDRDSEVAAASDVDQHGFGHDGGCRHDLCRKQERQRTRTADEFGSDQAHHRFARYAQRQCDSRLCRDDPEPDLADLLGNGRIVLSLQVLGDHRPQDRLETGLELLRQARDLLGNVIDADCRRRGKQAEDEDIEAARSPLDGIGRRQRQCPGRHLAHIAEFRTPVFRRPVAAEEGVEAGEQARVDRNQIGEREAGIRQGRHEIEDTGHDRDRPWLDHGPCADGGGDIVFVRLCRQDDLRQGVAGDGQHDQAVQFREFSAREKRRGNQPEERGCQRGKDDCQQHAVVDEVCRMRSLLAIGQSLCEPALFAHRTHQCDEFDHDESRCKAA